MNPDKSLCLRKTVQQCSNLSRLDTKKSDKIEVDVERKRIDTFVALKDGSTTGDAELTDIRVGYDAKTYNTAGEAVREQVKDINNKILCLDNFVTTQDLNIISGEYLSFNGVITNDTNFSRTDYICCSGYSNIKIYTTYETTLCGFFDADKSYIKQFTVKIGINEIVVPYNACYYMLSNNNENINLMKIENKEYSLNASKIDNIESLINSIYITEDVKLNSNVMKGYYKINETSITMSDWYESYIFDVSIGDIITYKGKTNAKSILYDYIRVFDTDGNIVDTKQNDVGLHDISGEIVIRNRNASKMIITFLKENNNTITKNYYKITTNNDTRHKKIVWFGTSIPEGRYNGIGTSYPEIIGNKLGITVYNESVGSSRVHGYRRKYYISSDNPYGFVPNGNFTNAAKSITDDNNCKEWLIEHWQDDRYFPDGRFSSMTEADKERVRSWGYEKKLDKYLTDENFPDMFVFDYGRNDIWSEIDWTFDNSDPDSIYTSFQNAMNFLIRRILNFNNKAKIVIIGHYSNQERSSLDPVSVKDFPNMCAKAQLEVVDYWSIPICKLWELTGWSNKTINVNGKDMSVLSSWLPDSLHPHSDLTGKAINHIANLLIPFINNHLFS